MSAERMILGNNCIYNGDPKLTGLNRNVLIVGGTGSGKTVSFVEPALMEAKGYDSFQFVRNGYFCCDAKDSTGEHLVFNRIVSLKSSFKPKK